ncbi:MAG: hypothetical protein HQM11_10765 [SAR324 cluster bacterium]|nr:hypothetical protein [SAR324 cluster bacterium]
MVTRELLKSEIDRVKDEHLIALYNIIKVFELPEGSILPDSGIKPNEIETTQYPDWHHFIETSYGCLRDDPIERASQGNYETRETIE